jgi:hypothetical protein
MFLRKEEKSSGDFWREYEEKTGEKLLDRGLGKYVLGWDEFDEKKWNGIWGLIFTTTGGFHFHHFPQNNWIDALTQFAEKEPPKEKLIFIPKEKVLSIEFIVEKIWWKKIFNPSPPHLVVMYTDDAGNKKKLLFEAEYTIITHG